MAFTTPEFYKNQYFGNKISDADLPRLLERGAEQITALTFNRVTDTTFPNLNKYTTLIQKANCAVADILSTAEQKQGIASESTGNWSITYDTKTKIDNTNKDIYKTISMYLGRTGLMYPGVDCSVGTNSNIN